MNRLIEVPPGHPWSCTGCQVEVSLVRVKSHTQVTIAHDDDCPIFIARLRDLAPNLDLDTALTIRPGSATDLDAVANLFPRW
jgi:hypothetical protein